MTPKQTKQIIGEDRGKHMGQRHTKKLNGPEMTERAADTGGADGVETPTPRSEQTPKQTKQIIGEDRGKHMGQRHTKKLNGPEKTERAADTGGAEGVETPKPRSEQTSTQIRRRRGGCSGSPPHEHQLRRRSTGHAEGGRDGQNNGGPARSTRTTRGERRLRGDGMDAGTVKCGRRQQEGR